MIDIKDYKTILIYSPKDSNGNYPLNKHCALDVHNLQQEVIVMHCVVCTCQNRFEILPRFHIYSLKKKEEILSKYYNFYKILILIFYQSFCNKYMLDLLERWEHIIIVGDLKA
jgi:hypothetical protein